MKNKSKVPRLAVVIPCYNEELCIKTTVEKLHLVINDLIVKNKITKDSYIYAIDDGSKDRTWDIIEQLHKENQFVKGMKLIRNFGNQNAIIAGLESVREYGCDCAVSIDADLQQDEWSIEKFVDEYSKGAEIVIGIKTDRNIDIFWKKYTAYMFYKIINLLGVKIPADHSDYRLVSKKVLDIMKMYPEKLMFLRGFFHELGLKETCVKFDLKPRMTGVSKFNYVTLITLALDGIASCSIIPLRLVTFFGFFMSLFGFLFAFKVIFEKLMWNNLPSGFTTIIVLLCVFGGFQLLCLGIIGEYISQLYRELKARPRYIKGIELL